MVAPSGTVKDATELLTPSRSEAVRRVTGSVALELAVEDKGERVEAGQSVQQCSLGQEQVNQQRGKNRQEIACHWQQQIDPLLREGFGNQAEYAYMGDAHHQGHHLHGDFIQYFGGFHDRFGLASDQQYADAKHDSVENDAQHVTVGENPHRIAGDDIDQDLGDRRSLMSGHRRNGNTCHLKFIARANDLGQQYGGGDGDSGGQQIKTERLGADTAQRRYITDATHATDQGEGHQRHDQHFQRIDEHLADNIECTIDQPGIDEGVTGEQ